MAWTLCEAGSRSAPTHSIWPESRNQLNRASALACSRGKLDRNHFKALQGSSIDSNWLCEGGKRTNLGVAWDRERQTGEKWH